MSQASKTISNADGATVRAAINAAIARLATNGKGSGRPSDIAAAEYWIDDNTPSSTVWTVYFYDGTDDIVDSYFDTTKNIRIPAGIGAGTADIASASTADLGSTPETSITITGTTTITSFGTSMKPGQAKIVTFSGILTLTHNGSSLILPGGANITTAAGDQAIVHCLSSGNYRVMYERASGVPLSTLAATQTDQETATSNAVSVTPGTQQFHPSAAKFWIKCDSAGTINASYNVTSITDVGTGRVDVTIGADFSSANWACHVSVLDSVNIRFPQLIAQAAGTAQFICHSTGFVAADPTSWFISGHGDQ